MEGYNKNAVSLRVWKDRTIKEIDKRAEIYLTDEEIDAMYDMELRSITGHESQKNFEGYIRIGISEQAQRVGDKIKAAREAMKKQVLAGASGKAERTSRNL